MADKIKTRPKKLRGGDTIAVDQQVYLWRERLKKRGIVLGKGMKFDKDKAEKKRKEHAKGDPTKRKFFG